MKKVLSIFLTAAISAGSLVSAPDIALTRDFWNSPTFLNEFMGTYGFDGEREPKINSDESAVIQQIIPLIQANQTQQAINLLQSNITAASSAAMDFTLGNLYLQTGQNRQAERAYQASLRKFPNFMNAYKNLGTIFVQEGRYEDAIPLLVKTIELGGGTGVLYGVLGYSYLNIQKYASAENSYRNALLLDPENVDWKNGIIQAMNYQGKHSELIGILNEVISENPRNTDYWIFQANSYIALEDYPKAIANLELTDRMGRSTPKSLMLMGDLYLRQGVPESALVAYKKALGEGGTLDPDQFIRAASILVSQGNFTEGEEYINDIFRLMENRLSGPDKLELYNLQSEIYLATGEQDKAAETLENILTEDPMNGQALLNLASYYWNEGEYEEAEIMFARAEKLEDYEVPALVDHARMLVDQRKFDEAAELLRRVMILDPQDRIASYLDAVERAAAQS
jgi:tetratricopeptide (TPR) repeat protein